MRGRPLRFDVKLDFYFNDNADVESESVSWVRSGECGAGWGPTATHVAPTAPLTPQDGEPDDGGIVYIGQSTRI